MSSLPNVIAQTVGEMFVRGIQDIGAPQGSDSSSALIHEGGHAADAPVADATPTGGNMATTPVQQDAARTPTAAGSGDTTTADVVGTEPIVVVADRHEQHMLREMSAGQYDYYVELAGKTHYNEAAAWRALSYTPPRTYGGSLFKNLSAPVLRQIDASSANINMTQDYLPSLGGGAAGTEAALNRGVKIFVKNKLFDFSYTPPKYAFVPSSGSTSVAFASVPNSKNGGIRLDYGYNKNFGTNNWHWNQSGVADVFGVTNHSTEGARAAGYLVKSLKIGGRVLVVGGLVDSGYEIATSNNRVYETGRQASGWAGAIVGGEGGAQAGALIGAGIGAWFGGVGAVPGAAIGAVVGGVAGGAAGWRAGTVTYQTFFHK
jgi:hypothetical protein